MSKSAKTYILLLWLCGNILRLKSYTRTVLSFFAWVIFMKCFFEDAIKASHALKITLTTRNKSKDGGIPYHAAGTYIAKLIAKGYKVAVCEQIEDPKLAKGVVKRDVVRTPPNITNRHKKLIQLLCFYKSSVHKQ